MIKLSDIVELRQKIAETRKHLEEEEAALLVLERMLKRQPTHGMDSVAGTIVPPDYPHSGPINIDDLGVTVADSSPTVYENVKAAVSSFDTREFTVPHVEKALELMGKKIESKTPRARIAMLMTKLVEAKIVERTFRGKGSAPHKFKRITALSTTKENS